MKIQLMRKSVVMAAIGLSLAAVQVSAQCTGETKELEAYNTWVGASANQALVNAYHAKQCKIIEGLHSGGDPCPNTKITSHITVKNLQNQEMCHVFDYPKVGNNCTTCK